MGGIFFRLLMIIWAASASIGVAPAIVFGIAHAQGNWVQGDTAVLQGLDKITARISTLEAEVGTPQRFGSLMLTIHACTFKPPDEPPEHAALISVHSVDHDGVIVLEPVFQGWMFASSPAVSALEHPVYDVTVLSCK